MPTAVSAQLSLTLTGRLELSGASGELVLTLAPFFSGGGAAAGDSAYEVAVANGFVGSEAAWLASLQGAPGADGADGADGVDGASAYEVAVANGFVGTEADWLASLVGKSGIDGIDGTDGTDGADGADGAGVPPGGATGQILAKASATDFDTEWVDPPAGGSGSSHGHDTVSAALTADVLLDVAGWVGCLSVSLPAGTWVVLAQVQHIRGENIIENLGFRLFDGGTSISALEHYRPGRNNRVSSFSLHGVVTLAAAGAVQLQGRTSVPSVASRVIPNMPLTGETNNGTLLTAFRVG